MKYLVTTLQGDLHVVTAEHVLVETSGALTFYSQERLHAIDIVRCFSPRYWAQCRPATDDEVKALELNS